MNWLGSILTRGLALTLALCLLLFGGPGCVRGGHETGPSPASSPPGRAGSEPAPGAVPAPNPAPPSGQPSPAAPGGSLPLERPSLSQVPDEVRTWVQASLSVYAGQTKNSGEKTYILVTFGTKPTGGYAVEILKVDREADRLMARVRFTEPTPGQPVIQVLTNPYDLVAIPRTELPVDFVNADYPDRYIMRVLNTEMRPIVADSTWIKLFAPAPATEVAEVVSFEGVASVFEGTVNYRLRDSKLEVRSEGFTTACMGDWGYFSAQVELPPGLQAGSTVYLELYTISAKDGSEQDQVIVPLLVKG
ncbi:MAG: protease complex subunit PrcB family protein [Acetobacteraceae bacterium]|nr:protease complex subunit PrcB family protein [Acetobacteraceae bacterium]